MGCTCTPKCSAIITVNFHRWQYSHLQRTRASIFASKFEKWRHRGSGLTSGLGVDELRLPVRQFQRPNNRQNFCWINEEYRTGCAVWTYSTWATLALRMSLGIIHHGSLRAVRAAYACDCHLTREIVFMVNSCTLQWLQVSFQRKWQQAKLKQAI